MKEGCKEGKTEGSKGKDVMCEEARKLGKTVR